MRENKKINKYLNFARVLKKLWNMNMIMIPIVIGALRTIIKRLKQKQQKKGDQRMNQDHSTIKIRENTLTSPWDMRRLPVTPVKDLTVKTGMKNHTEWKILFDKEIRMDHQIQARRPNLVFINKLKN